MMSASGSQQSLRRIRSICLALPEVTERLSHSAPSFFVQDKRAFVNVWMEGHHANRFPHLWCAAAPGVQEVFIETDPHLYFRPPYVGHRGWIGVRIEGDSSWDDVEDCCEDAYRAVAPPALIALLGDE
jgi:hypothetical protein